ncbi:MAG: glutamine synthetase [Nitrospirae bacterium]|nr:glutamine synthetase [Nitrospirota bacterium]MBI3595360.1 glutamine synthetase [Nitrospirota bacterium]
MDKVMRGMLTVGELAKMVKKGEIETVILSFTDHYGRLMGKRLDAEFFLEVGVKQGTHACDYLLTVDMENEPVRGYRFANWEKGYGDFHMVPDLATLRMASWLDKSAIVICDLEDEKRGGAVQQAPRTILKKQVQRASKLGYTVMAASELEYYLFRTSYKEAWEKQYQNLESVGWYLEDYHILQGTREEEFHSAVRKHLKQSGIPVENSKGEWGLGQHELNVRYDKILEMADRHVIYKECLKEVAEKMGISVTFMAKFSSVQAGSSSHIHLSLRKNGKNVFPGKKRLGPLQCSDVFRWFLGGWIAHVPDFMVFYAPTINSYKRYQSGSWAPTRLAWSYDNRTGGFRVVGKDESLRIECRIPGADCNPYLAFAAALASGLDGIEKKMEPPPVFEGDIYSAEDLPRVPSTLREATEIFGQSDVVKQTFGDEVAEHYLHFYRSEQEAFDRAVTDWERIRYFERI